MSHLRCRQGCSSTVHAIIAYDSVDHGWRVGLPNSPLWEGWVGLESSLGNLGLGRSRHRWRKPSVHCCSTRFGFILHRRWRPHPTSVCLRGNPHRMSMKSDLPLHPTPSIPWHAAAVSLVVDPYRDCCSTFFLLVKLITLPGGFSLFINTLILNELPWLIGGFQIIDMKQNSKTHEKKRVYESFASLIWWSFHIFGWWN